MPYCNAVGKPTAKTIDNQRPKTLLEKTGAAIWENLYVCSIPYKDSLSISDLKNFGIASVGDAGLDKEMHTQPLVVMINIDTIVEYYKKGVIVTLLNNHDAGAIYDIVNNYLVAWKNQLENSLNIGDAPYDDLIALDEFAKTLYPVAKVFSNRFRAPQGAYNRLFGGSSAMIGRHTLFGDLNKPKNDNASKEEHVSYSKVFTKILRPAGGVHWK